ncbi:MAG: protein kinase [Bacteroidota bacterium]
MIGRVIGNYRIDAKLGQGGMGAVYKGLDLMLERPVAIKALRADIAASPQHVERFRQEARTLARLLHPHIATLYALLREGDDLYMVMEFVEGETFEAVLHRERRIPVDHALRLFDQALRGIDHAHQRGIIHRDVKPANFMVMPSGTVKVMDFGIARLLGTTRMTQTRHAIGTAEYMAPEQVRAREVDARTDVYALGILLYEMVTGRVPFEAESSFETMQAHLQAAPRPPRVLTSDLPESVEAAILTALAKAPEDRHASVADFREALADVIPTGPPVPLPASFAAPPEPTEPAPAPIVATPPPGPAPETVIAPAREEPPKITDELALDDNPPDADASDETVPDEASNDELTTAETDAPSTEDEADSTEDDATSSPDDDPPTVPSPATRVAAPATVVADAVISDPDSTTPATVIAPAAVAPTVVARSPAPETTLEHP